MVSDEPLSGNYRRGTSYKLTLSQSWTAPNVSTVDSTWDEVNTQLRSSPLQRLAGASRDKRIATFNTLFEIEQGIERLSRGAGIVVDFVGQAHNKEIWENFTRFSMSFCQD